MTRTLFLLGLLPLLPLLAGCQDKPKASAPPEVAVPVLTQPVRSVSQNQAVPVSGALEADQTVGLGFQLGGQVQQVYVEEGAAVRKGQLLATLNASSYQYALAAATATLARAQDQYGRFKIMFGAASRPVTSTRPRRPTARRRPGNTWPA